MDVGTLFRRRRLVRRYRRRGWMNVGVLPRRRQLRVLRRRGWSSRCLGGCRLGRLLVLLLRNRLVRLVVVALRPNRLLLFGSAGIASAGVLALVNGQRCRCRDRLPVPAVPPSASCFPALTPVLSPARRRISLPATEVDWRLAVVANRNTQHEQRHVLGADQLPGAVVPAARVPGVAGVDPIQTVVE